jgi:hypothetical protein
LPVAPTLESELIHLFALFLDAVQQFGLFYLMQFVHAIQVRVEFCLKDHDFVEEVGILCLNDTLDFLSPLLSLVFLRETLVFDFSFIELALVCQGLTFLHQLLIFKFELLNIGLICVFEPLNLLDAESFPFSDSLLQVLVMAFRLSQLSL